MKRFLLAIGLCLACVGLHGAPKPTRMPADSVESLVRRQSRNILGLNDLLKTFRAGGDSAAVGRTLSAIGKYYNNSGDYIKSIDAYKEAYSIEAKYSTVSQSVYTLIGLATSCRRIGAYSSASDYLFEALMLLESSDIFNTPEGKKQRSYVYNGLGNVYKYLDNGTEAENYFRKSLALDEEIDNYLGIAMNLSTIGNIYEYRHEYDSAAVMYARALEYNKKTNARSGIGVSYNRLGQLAWTVGDSKKAEESFLAGYDTLKRAGDRWNLAKSATSLAYIYTENGQYDKAQRYLDEAHSIVRGKHAFGYEAEIHAYQAELNARQGNWRSAYSEALRSMAYADSSSTQKNEQAVAQSRIKFEQERNRMEMSKVLHEKEIEVERRNLILILGVTISLALLLIIILLVRNVRLQKKRNAELLEANAVKNKFFSIISHDLKNPVIAQKNTLQLIVDNYEKLPKDLVYAQCKELSKSSESLLSLLMSLLDWSRLEVGKMRCEPIRINLLNVIEDTVRPLAEQMSLKNINLRTKVRSDLYANADINITSTVLRNLVSNAIKFSSPGDSILIGVSEEGNGKLRLSVSDSGVGMSREDIDNLFKLTNAATTRGTAGETGSGLGLIVCREMLSLAGSSLQVSSELGSGSTFSFVVDKTE